MRSILFTMMRTDDRNLQDIDHPMYKHKVDTESNASKKLEKFIILDETIDIIRRRYNEIV